MIASNLYTQRWAVIVNPIAGKRHHRHLLDDVCKLLSRYNIIYTCEKTLAAGHATVLAKQLADEGCRVFLVVGGDGTFSETVNGLCLSQVDTSELTLALLPCGTGNDWARYWQLTNKLDGFETMLREPHVESVDLGRISSDENPDGIDRYFINGAGFGFDAQVLRITNSLKTVFGGKAWLYKLAVVMALFKVRAKQLTLSHDGETIQFPLFTMAIGNGSYSGGGLKQVATANPTDGLLSVMALPTFKVKDLWSIVKTLFGGTLVYHPIVKRLDFTQMTISPSEPLLAETDGIATRYTKPFSVSVVPNAINMMLPK